MSARHLVASLAVGLLALAATFAAPGAALAAGGGGESDMLWRVVNLVLLIAVLFVFARKPIQAWFRDRRDRIQGEVESAAQMRREAEEHYARWNRRLADLDQELAGIRSTARERAEAERDRILADARAAAERIRNDARVAIDQELRRAREELREEAADLSVRIAGDWLRDRVTDGDRDRLLDEFISTIQGPAGKGAGNGSSSGG